MFPIYKVLDILHAALTKRLFYVGSSLRASVGFSYQLSHYRDVDHCWELNDFVLAFVSFSQKQSRIRGARETCFGHRISIQQTLCQASAFVMLDRI